MPHERVSAARERLERAGFTGDPQRRNPHPVTRPRTPDELRSTVRAAKARGGASRADIAAYESSPSYKLDRRQQGGEVSADSATRAIAGAARGTVRGARAVYRAVPSSPGAAVGILGKLVVAVAVAVVGLEVASQVSGQYFQWDLKGAGQKVKAAGQALDLYPGQSVKLAAQTPGAVAAHPTPGVAPTVTL